MNKILSTTKKDDRMGGVLTKNAEVLRHFYEQKTLLKKETYHHHSNLHFDLLYSKKHKKLIHTSGSCMVASHPSFQSV